MSITAIHRYRCTECGLPLTDRTSRLFMVGPECRKGMSDAELAEAMRRTREAADPFHIPAEKAPSVHAERTNSATRHLIKDAQAPAVCDRHGGLLGACAVCQYEDDHPAERILAQIRSLTHEERRAERVTVLTARYSFGGR